MAEAAPRGPLPVRQLLAREFDLFCVANRRLQTYDIRP